MRSAMTNYGLALAALTAAILLRWLLDPLMGNTLALVTLFGAVASAVWLGGYRPALLVMGLGYLACHYLFIEPRGTLNFAVLQNQVGLVAYLVTCSIIVGFGEAMRAAQARVTEQRELLRVTLASIGDAVITTDTHGRVTYLNAIAEALTGWPLGVAAGQPLETVFRIVNEQTHASIDNLVQRALTGGAITGL
ncbi:MAG: DUF4118 domain-containing protein, partial [Legionella sp.]|nr:DUF4118 domain-containing protein [Legionella sp.]